MTVGELTQWLREADLPPDAPVRIANVIPSGPDTIQSHECAVTTSASYAGADGRRGAIILVTRINATADSDLPAILGELYSRMDGLEVESVSLVKTITKRIE